MAKIIRTISIVPAVVFLACALAWRPSGASAFAGTPRSWARFAREHHCLLAVEDGYSAKRGYIGYPDIPGPLPQSVNSISDLVKWLRAKLPSSTVWRDRANNHIIHVVYTKALKWKDNPLNQRLTFHGKMSLPEMASRVVEKKFPKTSLTCMGYVRYGVLPYFGTTIEKEYRDTVMNFDVKGMTLRSFLTTGMIYNLKGPNPPPEIWRADYYLKHGKFTGKVVIIVHGMPLRAGPSAAAKKHARKSVK